MTPNEMAQLCAINPLAWADLGSVDLGHSLFQTKGFEFLHEPYQNRPRRKCVCKATQQGWTELEVLCALHGCIHKLYPLGVLYLMPRSKTVEKFSASRFNPLINNNYNLIGKYVSGNAADLKKVGDSFLYFRSGKLGDSTAANEKAADHLKNIPVDRLVCDELDEMDPDAIPIAIERMGDSQNKEESYLGNPTIPDYGIDAKFQESDQRYYYLRCDACGHDTCLEIEFPNALRKKGGKHSARNTVINTAAAGEVYRACIKCGAEIFTRNGQWIPSKPSRSDYMHGYSISHLNNRNQDPAEILSDFHEATKNKDEKKLTAVYRLKLGQAYISAEERLRKNDVLGCCGPDPMMVSHSGPCAAGVDVGDLLNVVIAHRVGSKKIKAVKFARVSSFNDVHDLFRRFHVRSAVFDLKPEIRKVREFCNTAPFSCMGCDYNENQRGVAAWDEKSNTVIVNRTELLDASHDLVTTPGRYEIPRKNDEVDVYATQMCNTAKILEEDPETGSKTYRYRGKIGGKDDYRHATNYLLLACERIQPIVHRATPVQKDVEYYYG